MNTSISKIEREIIEEFGLFDNWIDKYDYLIDLGKSLPKIDESEKTIENIITGCQSQVWLNAKKPSEREHVTPYFYNNPDLFKIINLEHSKNISNLRWTIDQENDLKLFQTIISKINHRPILLNDILALYSKEPKLFEQNKPIIQNEGYIKSLKDEKIKNNT
jgi:spore coat polysaccharide biosynthesis protein SpsF (cytidylyltransferase family)